ncbi:helix-turn-helix domain-containing protein [Streptomyces sp. NPDC002328]|uniref:helix-turn-helix domain-containing protein n=1 Tax=Streptomyces sp. NPDC002328 TaxID=3364642 RepID=UPI0036CD2C32
MSAAQDDVEGFAALLTELKARTQRSYGSLARRLGMNTSTLHRYCAGDAVPQDFAPVERLAEFCGASPQERLELHRRWLLAVEARQRPRAAPSGEAAESDGEGTPVLRVLREAPDTLGAPVAVGGESAPLPSSPGRPWYRRRRPALLASVACAVLATVGALSALPAGDPPSSDAARRPSAAAPPNRTTAPAGARPAPAPSVSPSPGATSAAPTIEGKSAATGGGTGTGPSTGAGAGPSTTTAGPTAPTAPVPLTWTVDSQVWALGCGHDYVVSEPPARVPPPPAAQDAGVWAAAQGAVHGRETNVEIAVQGRGSTAVVLTALRVRVVGRADPAPGNAYSMDQGCGSSLTPRSFAVDLDKDRPIARAVPGNDAGTPIPAVRMPYRVSADDPEVLLVTARTAACDCSWYLELDWSSQGRTGTVRVDDHGRPFRTRSITGLPRYTYDTSARHWSPYS